MTAPLIERLIARIAVDEVSGCWVWGEPNPKGGGYKSIMVNAKVMMVHKAAYELFRGALPEKPLELDHICHTNDESCIAGVYCSHRRCVNPQHLEVVTRKENLLRRHSNEARKTHCDQGHPFDEANTSYNHLGWRRCKTCNRNRVAAWRRRVAA